MSNFMKIHQVGSELLHADRQMDGHEEKVIATFPNFANAPINDSSYASFTLHIEIR